MKLFAHLFVGGADAVHDLSALVLTKMQVLPADVAVNDVLHRVSQQLHL